GDAVGAELVNLPHNTDFEVTVLVDTVVGRSSSSTPSRIVRTQKLPSPARQLIDFYHDNRATLATATPASPKAPATNRPQPWDRNGGRKAWEAVTESGSTTLFLGFSTTAIRRCGPGPFEGETAVLMVDVAPEFKPEVKGAPVTDAENVLVLIFAGPTGHG